MLPMSAAARKIPLTWEVTYAPEAWEIEDDVKVPQAVYQGEIARDLIDVLKTRAETTGAPWGVGGDFALRWDEEHPEVGVDPDVYLVEPPLPRGLLEKSLRTWIEGHTAPRLVIEVVSDSTSDEDYIHKPARYAACGIKELWVFDPLKIGPTGGPAFRLQIWRRDAGGGLRRTYAGEGPAFSEELGAWLVVQEGGMRLRIADDARATHVWPTAAERERAEKERERARADFEHERAEKERAEKEALADEIARLKAELAATKR